MVPRILVVVIVPKAPANWVSETKDQLVMHRRAYWVSLAGLPATTNKGSVTVDVPKKQPFSVSELSRLMKLIDRTGRI
jgi:hypothetical protein